ncbi:hypothetical protein [Nocardia salmonicida]|uniref:hypothetical protein n=1 Tax=Nocardia salmonicida TaxID=53431 RepID=UPI003436857D
MINTTSYFTQDAIGSLGRILSFFSKEPGFGSEWQQGVFWLLTPLKEYIPTSEHLNSLPWYLVQVPLEYGFVGYLDINAAALVLLLLIGLIVVAPVMTINKRPEVRQAGFVAAGFGVLFGLTVFLYNVVIWPWGVSALWVRFVPLGVTAIAVGISFAICRRRIRRC